MSPSGRRRAHARQRFETTTSRVSTSSYTMVGEELMRDSALKLILGVTTPVPRFSSEKSSCATAL